ncbi:MAG: phosphoglucosamine mutase [bacterium]
MERLQVSISGLRGIIGNTLTPEVINQWVSSYATWLGGGKVGIGSDTRTSNEMIKSICIGALVATGCDVIDLGVVPTPTLALMIKEKEMSGGICITASHNPIEWNGLKFYTSQGLILNQLQLNELQDIVSNKRPRYAQWKNIGQKIIGRDASEIHINKILATSFINKEHIRKRGFRVACDCFHGAGGLIVPRLLEELGCIIFKHGCEMDGLFPGDPEPRSENLKKLGEIVRVNNCDLGIAVDPDVDRLALVDENGIALTEELTLALAVKLITSKRAGPVVSNLSTSLVTFDAASVNRCPFYRSKIGEINVIEKMIEVGAIIGGEGNGGVILPDVHLVRDAVTGIALILQLLYESDRPLSGLKNTLPSYYLHKQKLSLVDIDMNALSLALSKKFPEWQISSHDGYRFSNERKWFQVRVSNTEPVIRLFVETPSKEESLQLAKELQNYIENFSQKAN